MTDTCSPAQLFRRLFRKAIISVAKADGMSDEEIRVYEAGRCLA